MSNSFFEMYMKAGLPEKVVDMVRRTLDEAYRVKPGVLNFWVVSLNEAGFRKEGEQIDVATGRSGKRRQMGIPGFGWSGSSTMDKSSKGPLGAALRSR